MIYLEKVRTLLERSLSPNSPLTDPWLLPYTHLEIDRNAIKHNHPFCLNRENTSFAVGSETRTFITAQIQTRILKAIYRLISPSP